MTKHELISKIKKDGLWTVNKEGYYTKIWEENNYIMLRTYNTASDKSYIAETYKQKPDELIWDLNNIPILLTINYPNIVAIGQPEAKTDIFADEEFEKSKRIIHNAILVDCSLACKLASVECKVFAI